MEGEEEKMAADRYESIHCPSCGNNIHTVGAAYCENCGAKLPAGKRTLLELVLVHELTPYSISPTADLSLLTVVEGSLTTYKVVGASYYER